MPLPIKSLTTEELTALTQCNMSREIIAIKQDAQGGPKIIKISRDEVTCWQLFLRIFGCGTLAKLKVHLTDVAAYLNQYDWSEGRILNNGSELYRAYSKAALIANKAVLHKGDETLFKNVALVEVEKILEHTRFRGNEIVSRLAVREGVQWNPSLQAKHVKALIELRHSRYSPTTVRIEDTNHHIMPPETNVSLQTLNSMRIYLEQREALPQPAPAHKKLPKKRTVGTQTVAV